MIDGIAGIGAIVIAYLQELGSNQRFTAEQRLAARIALSEAFHATTGYYADLANGAARDPKEQHRIAHLWEQAAIRMEGFNPSLASRLGLKERYWREGATWSDAQIADARIQLDAVRQEARFALICRRANI